MALESHIEALHRQHTEIQEKIDEAMAHPSVCGLEIAALKRRKLAVKDKIYELLPKLGTSNNMVPAE